MIMGTFWRVVIFLGRQSSLFWGWHSSVPCATGWPSQGGSCWRRQDAYDTGHLLNGRCYCWSNQDSTWGAWSSNNKINSWIGSLSSALHFTKIWSPLICRFHWLCCWGKHRSCLKIGNCFLIVWSRYILNAIILWNTVRMPFLTSTLSIFKQDQMFFSSLSRPKENVFQTLMLHNASHFAIAGQECCSTHWKPFWNYTVHLVKGACVRAGLCWFAGALSSSFVGTLGRCKPVRSSSRCAKLHPS